MKFSTPLVTRFSTIILVLLIAIQIKYSLIQDPSHNFEFDYIIVGAGTAGCVVAGSLISNSNYTVLIIEAGDYFNALTQIPTAATLLQGSKHDWSLKTEPQMYSSFGMLNHAQAYPRGKGLGGSGQLNYLVHMEPTANDYEQWKNQNITTWNYESMFPFFRKLESFIHIMDNKVMDNTDLQTTFQKIQTEIKNITVKTIRSTIFEGKRWSSFDGYLKPVLRDPKLHILLNTEVSKILFSKKKAIGIMTESTKIPRILVRKQVILCAGVVHSPQILLRSGIGSQKSLKKLNISTVANLKGVGKNLYDHLNTPLFVSIEKPVSVTAVKILCVSEIWKYIRQKEGLLASLPIMGRARTVDDQTFILFGMGSTDEGLLREIGNYRPDVFHSLFPLYHNISQEGFVFLSSCLYPKSRGSITLENTDKRTPKINPNYLENHSDVTCMIKALRMSRKILHTKKFQSLGAKIHWPKLRQCENYVHLSIEHMECIIRMGSLTGYHPGGTCRMGNDELSVVNENLEVRGVQGLRVVDASVMPSPIVHFPNSFIIAMADRATTLILNDSK
ncbi:neither inactivation nor afterpotential protein G [Chrysoperla carnea]|uniref:neither inactivation nor afterpotential protein G n=1 Tax=Chrysoperla carnea TaxID=189513 RepID=UPI001D0940BE|nr:neither inactivation nor afterpotential protein G [Chrysoperla carnea]